MQQNRTQHDSKAFKKEEIRCIIEKKYTTFLGKAQDW